MTLDSKRASSPEPLIDRADERLQDRSGLSGSIRAFIDRVRSGDLGSLPVIIGLIIISAIFQYINPVFLSAGNLVNLLFDCSTIGVISLGIVCILMVGEIDLSVGSVSGLASALLGVIWVNSGWPVVVAIAAALLTGALIGSIYAFMFNRFGMPSFVSTLAGLLAVLGLQLYILGSTGSINLPYDSALTNFGQILVMPDWLSYLLVAVIGISMLSTRMRTAVRRRAAGLSASSTGAALLQAGAITAIIGLVVIYLNQSRGVPWMFGLFVGLVVLMNYAFTRTQWGRAMTAVGGNREAARRAGINVKRIYTAAFVLCATLAAAGGVLRLHDLLLPVSRLAPATSTSTLSRPPSSVEPVCSGRGSAYSALLGIIVIQAIASGLTLLDLSSSLRYDHRRRACGRSDR